MIPNLNDKLLLRIRRNIKNLDIANNKHITFTVYFNFFMHFYCQRKYPLIKNQAMKGLIEINDW